MISLRHRLVAVVTAGSLVLAPIAATLPATAKAPFDPAVCEVADEAAFRIQVEAITGDALKNGLSNVDYLSLVTAQWRTNGIDRTIDAEVDLAIDQIRDESSWGTLLKSIASKEAAQKLAMEAAERVYQSPTVKAEIEKLSVDVGRELGGRLELATIDAAVPAVGCVRAFLGPRFGSTITGMMTTRTAREFEVSSAKGSANVGNADVAVEGKEAIAGVIVLLVRRSLANLAKRIGRRVVGAVLSRVVSVVAGGIGLILLAKDIWDFRNGVLPIISEEMKAAETKENIRKEIAIAIDEQLGSHVTELSVATADRILEVWHEFKAAHAKVLELTERYPNFRAFVDKVEPVAMPKVNSVVALVLESEGEAGVLKRLEYGTLDRAVKQLPDQALAIAADTRSIEDAFQWSALAGDSLEKVVAFDIHRHAKPTDFTKEGLARILALEDDRSVAALVRLSPRDRDSLTGLPPDQLHSLIDGMSPADLEQLAGYLSRLNKDAAASLLTAVGVNPSQMAMFANSRVREAVLASRDQVAAVEIVLRTSELIDFANTKRDVELALKGAISPWLIWEKHPVAVIAAAILALMILMMFNRVLFGGRRRPIMVPR